MLGIGSTSLKVFWSIFVGTNIPRSLTSKLTDSLSCVLKVNEAFFRLGLKKRKPASDTLSPFRMFLIGNLIFKASSVDKTVNGLPVSISASTTPKKRGDLATKDTKGKILPL